MIVPKVDKEEGLIQISYSLKTCYRYMAKEKTGSNKGVYVQNTQDFIYPSPKGIQIVLVSVEADKKD